MKVNVASIVASAIAVIGGGVMLDFLNHLTPDPGFYTSFYIIWWWMTAVSIPINAIILFVRIGAWAEKHW